MFYPVFPFVRANYLLMEICTWETCYGDYDLAPAEFREMEGWLLCNFAWYMLAALYLNQVIPQDYGVPKHPLFLFEGIIKAVNSSLHYQIFGDDSHLQLIKDKNELIDEDSDVQNER
jgi:hypothetical protein